MNWYAGNSTEEKKFREKRAQGIMLAIKHQNKVTQVTWHFKGDYFAALSPLAHSLGVVLHQFSTRQSQRPFRAKVIEKEGSKSTTLIVPSNQTIVYCCYANLCQII